jgi:hypothetical protein
MRRASARRRRLAGFTAVRNEFVKVQLSWLVTVPRRPWYPASAMRAGDYHTKQNLSHFD